MMKQNLETYSPSLDMDLEDESVKVFDADFDSWKKLELETKYYNPNLHRGSFALPTYVEKILKKVE